MALCLLNKTAFGLSNQVGDCQIRLAEKVNKSHRLTVSPCHRLLILPRLLLRFMHDCHILLRQELSSPSTDTGQQWRPPHQARLHASAGAPGSTASK